MYTAVSKTQLRNMRFPRVVTVDGNVIEANDEQPEKIPSPRALMEDGRVTAVSEEQPRKT